MLEAVAVAVGPKFFQLIDESNASQGMLAGVRAVCKCLNAFVERWQLALAEGKKRPRLLVVGRAPPRGEDIPKIGRDAMQVVEESGSALVFGARLNPALASEQQLKETLGVVRAEA